MVLSFLVILFLIEEKNSYLYIANCININRFNMKLESNKYNGRTIRFSEKKSHSRQVLPKYPMN